MPCHEPSATAWGRIPAHALTTRYLATTQL